MSTIRISQHDHAADRGMVYDADGCRCTVCGQRWVLVHGETRGKDRMVSQEYAGSHPSVRVDVR